MLKKRGELATNQLVVIILVALILIIVFPITVSMANTTDYETQRITCLNNAIIRDKIPQMGRDLLYDLDCPTSNFIVTNDQIQYEKIVKEDGEKKISYKNIVKYKEENINKEVYGFVGKQVLSGWKSLGGGSLSIQGSKGEKNCLVISTITFQLKDEGTTKFQFDEDLLLSEMIETKVKGTNKQETINDALKSDNGESIFYLPKGFSSSNEKLYIVYLASDEKNDVTKSQYSIFLGHAEDLSTECSRFIT